jgi:NADPH:quinone reductase-like Zn-dependent oxidoreductase
MENMKAVRVHSYGCHDVLRCEDSRGPRPASGEVLVRAHAAAVNPVSGVVEAVGPGVSLLDDARCARFHTAGLKAVRKVLIHGGLEESAASRSNLSGGRAHTSRAQLPAVTDAGKIKPIVDTVLPLSGARQAQEMNESGHSRAKIVLKVA